MTERGVAVAQACRELELSESVLRRWMRELDGAPLGAFPGNGRASAEHAEIVALRKEVARLKAERDILKKGVAIVRHWSEDNGRARSSRGTRHEVRFHREASPCLAGQLAVCGARRLAVGVPCLAERPVSARAAHDEKIGSVMRKSFKDSDRPYGARRIWRDVLEKGLHCGLHRIERLMRVNGLKARPRRRGLPKDDGERSVITDNVLDRDFQADRPNQTWLADFTYIWTAEGWLYVAAVLDLFSRRIVGWSMKAERDASLVMDAFMMAVWRRGKADAWLASSRSGGLSLRASSSSVSWPITASPAR